MPLVAPTFADRVIDMGTVPLEEAAWARTLDFLTHRQPPQGDLSEVPPEETLCPVPNLDELPHWAE